MSGVPAGLLTPQQIVETALTASTGAPTADGCVVVVNSSSSANIRWANNTVTTNGMRSDMIDLLPGMMMVSDMVPDDPGTWLFHCHVNDHILAGMLTRYRVVA